VDQAADKIFEGQFDNVIEEDTPVPGPSLKDKEVIVRQFA
jgi:hypothetical protein